MSVTCVVGVNWGDEGKGRMVDYLAEHVNIVSRYQGGNNAGHTIVNDFGEFKLNLIPSGIFYPHVLNVLGPGMVIDLESLVSEIGRLEERGIDTSNLRISERATICFPYHRVEDAWEEERLGGASFGSTKRGIAPAYGDRYMKKALQVGDILDNKRLEERLRVVLGWKNAAYQGLYPGHEPFSVEEMAEWALATRERLSSLICNTTDILEAAAKAGKHILFEAQLGALRDITFGIYPYTSSSSSLAANAPVGAGLFSRLPDRVVGVMKAFSTCVGEGPFVTEMSGTEAHELRERAGEYGAATGRPRRIGHFDAVASRYGAQIQSATELAITKLDSLSGTEELKIATRYRIDGDETPGFPLNGLLDRAEAVYETMPGWDEDISSVRSFTDLPVAAQRYVERIEELVGVKVPFVSVGPEREALIERS